jgi:hypothetical protein
LRAGDDDGHPVRDELVAPADGRAGNGVRDPAGDGGLGSLERPCLQLGAGLPAGCGERLLLERDDDLDEVAGGCRALRVRRRERQREQAEQADQETPAHGGHRRREI